MTAPAAISWKDAADHDQAAVVQLLTIQAERLEEMERNCVGYSGLRSLALSSQAAAYRAAIERLGGPR
jgi:hypothetical protein